MTRSIRGRLTVAGAVFGALLLLTGVAGWWSTRQLARVTRDTLGAVRMAAELSSRFGSTIALELMVAHQYVDTRETADGAAFQRLARDAHDIVVAMNSAVGQNADETALIARIDQQLALAESYYARAHRLADLGRREAAGRQAELAAPVTRALLADQQRLGAMMARKVVEVHGRLAADIRRRWIQQLVVVIGFLLVAGGVFRAVSRSIASPLDALVEHARRLSRGDFTARTAAAPLPLEFRVLAEAMNREGTALSALAQRAEELRATEKHAAVGQLVSGVAHAIADPLAGVLLQIERMLEERPDPGRRRTLEEIRDHTLRARRVVRDLLSFTRDRAAAHEPVELHDLTERAVGPAGIGDWLERNHVTLVNEVPPGRHRLLVDRVGIEQVIANLVLNAAQATGPGGRVTLRAEARGDGVALLVEDNGPGIAPDVLPRIFEPFFSGRPGDATGLGLSAALGIVAQHGGTLTAENGEPGGEGGANVGARITITLPHLWDTAEHAVPPAPAPRMAGPHAPRPRVLIVEPDASARSTLRRHFAAAGWRVDEAYGAEDAMSLLMPANAPEAFGLLIGDLTVPCPNGQLLQHRLLRERPDVLSRFVHLAAAPHAPEAQDLIAATGCRVIRRPLDLPELDALILERSHARV